MNQQPPTLLTSAFIRPLEIVLRAYYLLLGKIRATDFRGDFITIIAICLAWVLVSGYSDIAGLDKQKEVAWRFPIIEVAYWSVLFYFITTLYNKRRFYFNYWFAVAGVSILAWSLRTVLAYTPLSDLLVLLTVLGLLILGYGRILKDLSEGKDSNPYLTVASAFLGLFMLLFIIEGIK